MITHIEGIIDEVTPTHVVIDCSGIGYYLNISLTTFSKIESSINKKIRLVTHLHVREDSHTLYGFFERDERRIFRLLISVSGVGASTGMMILSSLNPIEINQAISSEDINTLKSIKGIGLKSAQRIIIDLKDKIKEVEIVENNFIDNNNIKKNQALSALETLGFSAKQSNKILDKILNEAPDISVEELIKLSLKNF
ncbi:MAG: Holliday junction branch migration protein RuvA [Flavobacteriales bacterium TMED113]|nr:MAG: Holliday junction branch migration protein RuvA [Flavobacteriales bacterium TMED113]|tara:strand:+ start:362 stop:949 length:588 start_codon:yes stop_codon:yes gene_type:complete